jgi:hypothetical protein
MNESLGRIVFAVQSAIGENPVRRYTVLANSAAEAIEIAQGLFQSQYEVAVEVGIIAFLSEREQPSINAELIREATRPSSPFDDTQGPEQGNGPEYISLNGLPRS